MLMPVPLVTAIALAVGVVVMAWERLTSPGGSKVQVSTFVVDRFGCHALQSHDFGGKGGKTVPFLQPRVFV